MIADELAGLLGSWCDEGVLATAGQLYAWWGDAAVDLVAGDHVDGRPLRSSDVAEVHCLTKPIVAAGALLALERGGVDLDAPVSSLLDDVDLPAAVTVPSIVNHDARLLEPSGLAWMLTPVHERPARREIRPHPGTERCYSEVSGWRLLVGVIERLSGQAAPHWIDDRVLEPLGLVGEVVLDGPALGDAVHDGRVLRPIGGLPVAAIPMLHVHAPGYRRRVGPELAGSASARAIGAFAEQLADVVAGGRRPGLPSPELLRAVVARAGPRGFDRTWGRDTAFALGYEVLPGAPRRWSLAAYPVAALVVVEPDRGVGACLILDGATPDPLDLARCRGRLLDVLGRGTAG